MANHCENHLRVIGTPEQLREFDNQFKKEHVRYSGGTLSNANLDVFHEDHPDVIHFREQDKKVVYIETIETITDKYSFRNFVPMSIDDYLNDWYEWSYANWGTKWDLTLLVQPKPITDETTEQLYIFNTANSPSLPVTRKMIEQFPDLQFKHIYRENGCQFGGVLVYINEDEMYEEETDENGYVLFNHDVFDEDVMMCADCGTLTLTYQIENNQCNTCESTDLVNYE